jgi:hypothetical protein
MGHHGDIMGYHGLSRCSSFKQVHLIRLILKRFI